MGYFDSIYASDLPHRARAVYMYLKDRTNKDGTCWPSIRTIARELKLSRATVCRALDDLCRAGLLEKSIKFCNGLISNEQTSARGEVCSLTDTGTVSPRDPQNGIL